jgi:hypothetical protein
MTWNLTEIPCLSYIIGTSTFCKKMVKKVGACALRDTAQKWGSKRHSVSVPSPTCVHVYIVMSIKNCSQEAFNKSSNVCSSSQKCDTADRLGKRRCCQQKITNANQNELRQIVRGVSGRYAKHACPRAQLDHNWRNVICVHIMNNFPCTIKTKNKQYISKYCENLNALFLCHTIVLTFIIINDHHITDVITYVITGTAIIVIMCISRGGNNNIIIS